MALDQTPGVVQTLSRSEVHDNWTRDYKLRVPAADVGPGTQPDVDASVAADAVAPLYNDAVTIGRGTTLRTSAGSYLQIIGEDEGIFKRPAVGASGFIAITTATGGATIQQGTVVVSKIGQKRYQVTTTQLYTSATLVPVVGIDTGPSTNLDPGAGMQFQAPPPGCAQDAVVVADSNGNGLTGGRDADDDATYRQLISDNRANPPASGNDAEYQKQIRKTPGLSIQQVFTYPGMPFGPGTISYVFTLNPARPGASRTPNGTQIAATLAYVTGQEPADDGVFACELVESSVIVALSITWGAGASTWMDATPWPTYVTGQVLVASSPAPSLTGFRLHAGTSTTDPQVGQNIGFYDSVSGTFKRFRILTVSVVSAGVTWDITVDRTFGASDPNYIPSAGQPASPWSDSLNLIAPAVIAYFDGLGPGEQVSPLPDPGLRQRRQPTSPIRWPSVIDARIVIPIYQLGNVVETVTPLLPALPFQTPVGAPGVTSNLCTLGSLAIYP